MKPRSAAGHIGMGLQYIYNYWAALDKPVIPNFYVYEHKSLGSPR